MNNSEPMRKITWVKFKNDAGSEVPRQGILRITGFTTDPEEGYFTVDQPNTYGSQYGHAINGDCPVPAGQYGYCCLGQVAPALYDTADSPPNFGEMWGPRNATWKLKKNTGGFMVLGLLSSTHGRVLVTPMPMLFFHGTAEAAIAEGASGDVNIIAGGSEVGVALSVHATYGAIEDEAMVACRYDELNALWRGIQTPCS